MRYFTWCLASIMAQLIQDLAVLDFLQAQDCGFIVRSREQRSRPVPLLGEGATSAWPTRFDCPPVRCRKTIQRSLPAQPLRQVIAAAGAAMPAATAVQDKRFEQQPAGNDKPRSKDGNNAHFRTGRASGTQKRVVFRVPVSLLYNAASPSHSGQSLRASHVRRCYYH
jgi:hypothetical protein